MGKSHNYKLYYKIFNLYKEEPQLRLGIAALFRYSILHKGEKLPYTKCSVIHMSKLLGLPWNTCKKCYVYWKGAKLITLCDNYFKLTKFTSRCKKHNINLTPYLSKLGNIPTVKDVKRVLDAYMVSEPVFKKKYIRKELEKNLNKIKDPKSAKEYKQAKQKIKHLDNTYNSKKFIDYGESYAHMCKRCKISNRTAQKYIAWAIELNMIIKRNVIIKENVLKKKDFKQNKYDETSFSRYGKVYYIKKKYSVDVYRRCSNVYYTPEDNKSSEEFKRRLKNIVFALKKEPCIYHNKKFGYDMLMKYAGCLYGKIGKKYAYLWMVEHDFWSGTAYEQKEFTRIMFNNKILTLMEYKRKQCELYKNKRLMEKQAYETLTIEQKIEWHIRQKDSVQNFV